VGPGPDSFHIYGRRPQPIWPNPADNEYLNTTERLTYSINQYGCRTMSSLMEKLLQLPAGSTFDFAWEFDERDEKEILEIAQFLHDHDFKVT
jgi:hypothetical protein